MTKPRILLVNGNSREDLSARMSARAQRTLSGAAFVDTMTIRSAPAFIATPAQTVQAAAGILSELPPRALDPRGPRPDAVMLACFGEPGLLALRTVLPMPVTGMLESGALCAMQLGRRFAIRTTGRDWPGPMADLLAGYGVNGRCAGITALPDAALSDDPDEWRPALQAALNEEAALARADAVIFGGGALAGRIEGLTAPPGLRVIDCFDAALAQTLALAHLHRWRPGQTGDPDA